MQPGHIVLISPVLDATMQHPEIPDYLKKDPMVGVDGSVFLAEQWAGDTPLDNYKVSPINGDLDGLGRITLTVGTKEVLYPDALNLSQLLSAKVSNMTLYLDITNSIFIQYFRYQSADAFYTK